MRLLLDTRVWLWLQVSPERLGPALSTVQDPQHELLLSAASSWEIAITWAVGRLPLPAPPGSYLPDRIASSGVVPLGVTHSHAIAVASLPAHHGDPFDRILVAQAIVEGASLVTADEQLERYAVDVIRAG